MKFECVEKGNDKAELKSSKSVHGFTPYVPPISYPQQAKNTKKKASFDKFFEMFKNFNMNIPL